jgi:ABC-2 type transport system permease protein
MNVLAAKFRKHLVAGSTALRHRWASPGDLVGLVLSYGLFVFIFSRLWVTAYAGKAVLAGYTQHQLTWYFIAAELLVFGQGGAAFRNLSQDIKTGQIAYTLGRPRAYPVSAMAESLASTLSLAGPLALVGWMVGTLSAGLWAPGSVFQAGALVLSFLLSMVLLFLCQFLLALTAFWVEENAAFLWIHQKLALVLGTFLPLEFFPAVWRPWVEATPYGWLAYPPARILSSWDPNQVPGLLGGQLVWIALVGGTVGLVYAVGRRRTAVQGG